MTDRSFSLHWKNFASQEAPPSKKKSAQKFLDWVADNKDDFWDGLHVLDAGCGDGVHLNLLQSKTSNAVGFDIFVAPDASFNRFVQAEVHRVPFRREFDVVLAYGLLYYLPSPKEGFMSLARNVRRGGTFAVWNLYPSPLLRIAVDSARLFRMFGLKPTLFFSIGLAPLMAILPSASGVSIRRDGYKACAEVIHVHLAPHHLHWICKDTAKQWFTEAGFENLRELNEPRYGLLGIKK